MTRSDYPFGFRVVGPLTGERRLVDAAAALSGYAACDPRAEPHREGYLSAFRFGPDFRAHLETYGTPKGFAGPCWSPWAWFDIDRPDPEAAALDARRLAGSALERYRKLDEDDLLVFFSGRKGYHVGVPLPHNPDPSPAFHHVCRRFAEELAARAGVRIDALLYDKPRCLRAPNSRHPKTGLYKRRLTFGELMNLTPVGIAELAREPAPFDIPVVGEVVGEIEADWRAAAEAVAREGAARASRQHGGPSGGRLQRSTLGFIRDGADPGERHTRLFRAAGNLREFGAPEDLIHVLLTESALDSGLPPAEVARVIRCGIDDTDRRGGPAGAEGGAA